MQKSLVSYQALSGDATAMERQLMRVSLVISMLLETGAAQPIVNFVAGLELRGLALLAPNRIILKQIPDLQDMPMGGSSMDQKIGVLQRLLTTLDVKELISTRAVPGLQLDVALKDLKELPLLPKRFMRGVPVVSLGGEGEADVHELPSTMPETFSLPRTEGRIVRARSMDGCPGSRRQDYHRDGCFCS